MNGALIATGEIMAIGATDNSWDFCGRLHRKIDPSKHEE
jgi:hypothetical protein